MTDIVKVINDYLTATISPYTAIYQDVFPDATTNEIMCRHEPTPTNVKRYMNGSVLGVLHFTYYCKSKSLPTIQTACQNIINAIGGKRFDIENSLTIDVEQLSEPSFVERRDTREIIYTLPFEIQFTRG